MGERSFASGFVNKDAKLHIHIGQLRKRVVVTTEGDAAERQQTFLGHGKHIRFHPPDFVQLDSPILQRRIGDEIGEPFIVDCQDFRHNKRCGLGNFRK